jgi:hypothetical protein
MKRRDEGMKMKWRRKKRNEKERGTKERKRNKKRKKKRKEIQTKDKEKIAFSESLWGKRRSWLDRLDFCSRASTNGLCDAIS